MFRIATTHGTGDLTIPTLFAEYTTSTSRRRSRRGSTSCCHTSRPMPERSSRPSTRTNRRASPSGTSMVYFGSHAITEKCAPAPYRRSAGRRRRT